MKIDFAINFVRTNLVTGKSMFDKWVPVTGEIVDVAPHLEGTFALHRFMGAYGPGDGWSVSYVETGCSVVHEGTRAAAIEHARKALKNKTNAELAKAIRAKPIEVRQ